jgi:hypothetical protein
MDETINFVIGPRGQTRPIDGALLFMDVVFALLHIPRPSGGTRPARKSTNYTDRKVLIDESVDDCAGSGSNSGRADLISKFVKFISLAGIPETTYLTALKSFPSSVNHFLSNSVEDEVRPAVPVCTNMKKMRSPCRCHLELCIGWYPCGLKYCKGKGQSKNSVMTYRCGIKTCRKCHLFAYYVAQKQQCLWDE